MSISKTLVGLCLISCLSLISAQTLDSDNLTAYEMLEKYNFPKGILPQGVKSYTLNQDGSFAVFLNGNCKFDVEGGYSLNYKSRISGKVSFGSLKELQGVSVKVLFLWLSITEVDRGNGKLDFYVGPVSASFELVNFEESPQCGCGFNCGNLLSDSWSRSNLFWSSLDECFALLWLVIHFGCWRIMLMLCCALVDWSFMNLMWICLVSSELFGFLMQWDYYINEGPSKHPL